MKASREPPAARPAPGVRPEAAPAAPSPRRGAPPEPGPRTAPRGGLRALARGAAVRAFETRAGRLLAAARFRLFRRAKADLFELERPPGPVPPSRAAYPDGHVFREADRREAGACSRVMKLPEAESLRRFDAGDLCYVVADGARVATVIWVHDGPCYVRGLGYLHDRPTGEKYVYGIVTDPAERGKGLYKNALEDLAARLFSAGASRLVQIVEAGNAPVLATVPRLGYRRTRRIESILVLGVRRTVVTLAEPAPPEKSWRIAPPRGRFVI